MFRTLVQHVNDKVGLITVLSYGVIGALSAGINFLVFALCYDAVGFHYKAAGTISYIFAVIFNFISNRLITFQRGGHHLFRHFYRYLMMLFLNYIITMAVLHTLVDGMKLSPYIGLFFAIGITAVTGFSLSKLWVYR